MKIRKSDLSEGAPSPAPANSQKSSSSSSTVATSKKQTVESVNSSSSNSSGGSSNSLPPPTNSPPPPPPQKQRSRRRPTNSTKNSPPDSRKRRKIKDDEAEEFNALFANDDEEHASVPLPDEPYKYVHYFSTDLANKACQAVNSGECSNIIEFHVKVHGDPAEIMTMREKQRKREENLAKLEEIGGMLNVYPAKKREAEPDDSSSRKRSKFVRAGCPERFGSPGDFMRRRFNGPYGTPTADMQTALSPQQMSYDILGQELIITKTLNKQTSSSSSPATLIPRDQMAEPLSHMLHMTNNIPTNRTHDEKRYSSPTTGKGRTSSTREPPPIMQTYGPRMMMPPPPPVNNTFVNATMSIQQLNIQSLPEGVQHAQQMSITSAANTSMPPPHHHQHHQYQQPSAQMMAQHVTAPPPPDMMMHPPRPHFFRGQHPPMHPRCITPQQIRFRPPQMIDMMMTNSPSSSSKFIEPGTPMTRMMMPPPQQPHQRFVFINHHHQPMMDARHMEMMEGVGAPPHHHHHHHQQQPQQQQQPQFIDQYGQVIESCPPPSHSQMMMGVPCSSMMDPSTGMMVPIDQKTGRMHPMQPQPPHHLIYHYQQPPPPQPPQPQIPINHHQQQMCSSDFNPSSMFASDCMNPSPAYMQQQQQQPQQQPPQQQDHHQFINANNPATANSGHTGTCNQ